MRNYLQSSNPALTNAQVAEAANPFAYREDFAAPAARANVTTLQGVVNKTAILVGITILGGAAGYTLVYKVPGLMWMSAIAAFVLVLGFSFLLIRKPQLASTFGPIYAVVEGVFLGAFTAVADAILKSQGVAALGGVGLQAFIITICTVLVMLGLYQARIIRPTAKFKAVIFTLTGAIMLTYLVSFIMSFFWQPLPLISLWSAGTATGTMALLGLGLNVFILVIAALFLVIDFGEVEKHVAAASPKYMEWYLAFALLITLAWIYFEAVKLSVRLALIFGARD